MHRLVLAGLVPALLAAPSAARETPTATPTADHAESGVVTEADFLAALDELHPAVIERSRAVVEAQARVTAAGTLENLVFEAVREDPDGPETETEWTLSWQLPQPDRGARVDSERESERAARLRLSQDITELRIEMRRVYADWAAASTREGRLGAQASRVGALAEREAARAARGETSGLEAHRLALAANGLRTRADLAGAAASEARAQARRWNPEVPADARPELPTPPAAPDPSGEHPLVAAALAELEAATLAHEAAGRRVRSPALTAGWKRVELGPETADGPVLGISWPLPLIDRNQAERASTEARIVSAEARLESVRRAIAAERSAAIETYERLTTAHARSRAALADNAKMLDAAERAFRLGELGLTDLLETLRSVTESELSTLELRSAALTAHRELERLFGVRAQTP